MSINKEPKIAGKLNIETLEFETNGIYGYGNNKLKHPTWKQKILLRRKSENDAYRKLQMAKEYEESQIPEWKKPLVKLHARRKSEQSEKEFMERKRVEEAEKRFKALPAWKQQLILKKKSKGLDSDEGKGQHKRDVPNKLEDAKIENLGEFGKEESADINDQVEGGVDNDVELNENDRQSDEDNGTDNVVNGDVEVEEEKDQEKDEETGEVNDKEQNQEENKDEEAAVETDAEKDEDTAREKEVKDDHKEADAMKKEDKENETGTEKNEDKNKINKEDDVSKSDDEQ